MTTAGVVFSEDHVASPVIANLHAGPVPANEPEPLVRPILIGRCARQVVVSFGGAPIAFLETAGVTHYDHTSSIREVRLHGLDGESVQATGFDSSVSGFGGDKKGVPWSASSRCACLSKRF